MSLCRIGCEREACLQLLQKVYNFHEQGKMLEIKSAVCLDHLKGFIYVEAFKDSHVSKCMHLQYSTVQCSTVNRNTVFVKACTSMLFAQLCSCPHPLVSLSGHPPTRPICLRPYEACAPMARAPSCDISALHCQSCLVTQPDSLPNPRPFCQKVLEAIRGLRTIYSGKGAKLVPLKERPAAISVNRQAKAAIERDSWVRVRGGLYKDDLAKVRGCEGSW